MSGASAGARKKRSADFPEPCFNWQATPDLATRLQLRRQQVDACLDRLLPAATQYPESVHRAIRHSVFAGGKRVRPILCLEAAGAVAAGRGGARREPVELACALECIHTYSLIHDDLPALDNDDFRRGQPTCHKAFGEATAILAGDALLTLAFQIVSSVPGISGDRRAALVEELARAAGTVNGMIGGQIVDLDSEGREVSPATLEYLHRSKTGALLGASVRSGAIFAGAGRRALAALSEYGKHVGLLFQIVDDILDVEGSTASLGKTAGKDKAQKKATYPAVHGLDRSREIAGATLDAALRSLEPLGERARWLREMALFVGRRKY